MASIAARFDHSVSSDSGSFGSALAKVFKPLLVAGLALSEMGFLDHLEELRRRLIRCAIAVAVGVAISLTYTPELIRFLGRPAKVAGIPLQAIEATEIFSIYFKVALAGGICLAAPVILWQIWRFIEPALYKHEKRYAAPFILSTIFCFVAGGVFGYAIAAPWLLQLEVTLAKLVGIDLDMTSLSYFGLLTGTIVAMGAVFEMPPVVFILSRIGLIDALFLLRHFRHAVIISLIVAAAATPGGDLPPTIALTGVILALYAFSVLVALVFGRKRSSAD